MRKRIDGLLVAVANWFLRRTSQNYQIALGAIIERGMKVSELTNQEGPLDGKKTCA